MGRRWPLALAAAALFLASAVSVSTETELEWLAGIMAALGSVSLGVWISDSDPDAMQRRDDSPGSSENDKA